MKINRTLYSKFCSIIFLSLLMITCENLNFRGSYPGVIEESGKVPITELNTYYQIHTNGLIEFNSQYLNNYLISVNFIRDSYHKRKILPADSIKLEDYQALFKLDLDGFVKQSGSDDFIDAVYNFY